LVQTPTTTASYEEAIQTLISKKESVSLKTKAYP
jgi:hypothetical protein